MATASAMASLKRRTRRSVSARAVSPGLETKQCSDGLLCDRGDKLRTSALLMPTHWHDHQRLRSSLPSGAIEGDSNVDTCARSHSPLWGGKTRITDDEILMLLSRTYCHRVNALSAIIHSHHNIYTGTIALNFGCGPVVLQRWRDRLAFVLAISTAWKLLSSWSRGGSKTTNEKIIFVFEFQIL